MIVRDLFVEIDDRDELLSVYNREHDPEITREQLDDFVAQLLDTELAPGRDELKVVIRAMNGIHIAGEGWGMYDHTTWMHMDAWDVEWRPASEVLGLEIDDRVGLSRVTLTMWMLEELGVYLGRPRVGS
jgi:hypothetical protein